MPTIKQRIDITGAATISGDAVGNWSSNSIVGTNTGDIHNGLFIQPVIIPFPYSTGIIAGEIHLTVTGYTGLDSSVTFYTIVGSSVVDELAQIGILFAANPTPIIIGENIIQITPPALCLTGPITSYPFDASTPKIGMLLALDTGTTIHISGLWLIVSTTLPTGSWVIDGQNPANSLAVNFGDTIKLNSGKAAANAVAMLAYNASILAGNSVAVAIAAYNTAYAAYNQLNALDFTWFNAAYIQYTDLNSVVQQSNITTTWTSDSLEFVLANLVNVDTTQPITIVVVGNGTQFSGSVVLGTLTINIANGSGIYVITPGKTDDTLYVNSAVNATTANVKIPDPFIETAFIP